MKKSNILTYSISASLLIVALAVGCYFILFLPKIQRSKQDLETQKFEQQKIETQGRLTRELLKSKATMECEEISKNKMVEIADDIKASSVIKNIDDIEQTKKISFESCMKDKGYSE